MPSHTAIAALSKGQFGSIQVETSPPGAGAVLIKVHYASMIAFDTYIADVGFLVAEYPVTLGFNAAGVVVAVGTGVSLAIGDRVAAFTMYGQGRKDALQGTMQDYVALPEHLCAKVRPHPNVFRVLLTCTDPREHRARRRGDGPRQLPHRVLHAVRPARPAHPPILVYGAGSTAGQYALQLLRAAGYTNVVATAAPKHHAYLRALGATRVVDYASPTLAADIGGPVELALDAISTTSTLATVARLLAPAGAVAVLLPIKEGNTVAVGAAAMHAAFLEGTSPFAPETRIAYVRTFLYRDNAYMKENLMPKILPELLAKGIITPNRIRLLDEGSFEQRVAAGLDLLRNNKVSGEKVVVKVLKD
ncbi:chaperonin 10-like protein [Mycena belliarum]|uniref:Chaperonin 10-like protein n=1 Tax=Mycena belliarum TaxID=1033014 RepID=A0AAD6TQT5_9AGAR|nr:chaperonin 10-like protein [Mycena belliae]